MLSYAKLLVKLLLTQDNYVNLLLRSHFLQAGRPMKAREARKAQESPGRAREGKGPRGDIPQGRHREEGSPAQGEVRGGDQEGEREGDKL